MTAAPDHKGRAHAVCSASGAERWLNCPGSIGLSQGLPEEPPAPYALEGTRCHELAERILRHWESNERRLDEAWVDTLRPEYADTEFPTGDGRMWSMVDYAMTYVNVCLDQVAAFDAPPAVRIEHRLVLDQDLGMFGTLDFVCSGVRKGAATGMVVDLKYGKGKRVNPETSVQLAYYAAALKRNSKKKLEQVKVVVVQPRLPQFFSEWWYAAWELDEWEAKLKAGAEKAVRQMMGLEPRELKAGGWCWFCPARQVCPEQDKARAKKAAEEFAEAT
jgi:hypothetical protein